MIPIASYISAWKNFYSENLLPWEVTKNLSKILRKKIITIDSEYSIRDEIAVHPSAQIEAGAVVKGPAIIGPECFVAGTAYLRGGIYLEKNCSVGPSSELKTVLMFNESKVAHLNFVGDSIVGASVNIEAGAIVANYRNEFDTKEIRIRQRETIIETGTEKFGALIGDHTKIGANSVIAPGALIDSHTILPRMSHIDQYPSEIQQNQRGSN